MKKKIILFVLFVLFVCVITGIVTSITITMSNNNSLLENKFVLKNVEALTREDEATVIHAAEYKITCGTPLDNTGKACKFKVTTGQGVTSGTCTQVPCPDHH
jgi:uncharacterized protein YxeA